MAKRVVDSWEQLQADINSILKQINEDPQLALAAAANPLLALEEMGYEIGGAARTEIARRVRFSPRVAVRLRHLEDEVASIAGRKVDLDSAEDVRRLLFEDLGLEAPEQQAGYEQTAQTVQRRGKRPDRIALDTGPLPPDLSSVERGDDPLRALADRHEVMEPLLAYRRLEASTPRLASRQAYEAVRAGKVRLGIENLKGRLKAQPVSPEDRPGQDEAGAVLNLNEATADELEQIPGIGPALAERIVLYRTAYGPFSRLDTLTEIKGIGPDLLDRMKSHLTV